MSGAMACHYPDIAVILAASAWVLDRDSRPSSGFLLGARPGGRLDCSCCESADDRMGPDAVAPQLGLKQRDQVKGVVR